MHRLLVGLISLGIVGFLFGCSNRKLTASTRVAAASGLVGQIQREGSGSIMVGTDVTFLVTTPIAGQYRFVRSGEAVINFSGSTSYMKRYAVAGDYNETGVLQTLDASGQVTDSAVLTTGPFTVVDSASGSLKCTKLVAVPSVIYVEAGDGGLLKSPAFFTFYASTSQGARIQALTTRQGITPQLMSINSNLASEHKFRASINAFGAFLAEARFSDGTISASCEIALEVRPMQPVMPAPTCTASSLPAQVSAGNPVQISVSVGQQSPVNEVWVENLRLNTGVFTSELRLPVGTHQISLVVAGPGGVGNCATQVQVLPAGALGSPSCNFSPTSYRTPLNVGQNMVFSLTLNAGSPLPTSVFINGIPAFQNPTIPNQWDLGISFLAAGVFLVEGRVANSAGANSCFSNPITVTNLPVLPTCTLTLSEAESEVGEMFKATLTHTNSAASGDAISATITYAGLSFNSTEPYPTFSKSLLAAQGVGEVLGEVNGPMGTGSCRASINVTPKKCIGGANVGGKCWYLGTLGQSCDSTCAMRGGYDVARATAAHNVGGCSLVLNALRVPLPTAAVWAQPNNPPGLSCFWYLNTFSGWLHTASLPSGSAAFPTAQRACACRD